MSESNPSPAERSEQQPLEDHAPHKPADDREEVYFTGSPKLRGELGRLFGWGLAGLVLIAIPVAWWKMAKEGSGPGMLVWLICIVAGLALMVVPMVLVRALRYRISNYRIDYERGLLSRRIDTLELWHVEDISFYQSLMDRLMNVGTLTIVSHDDTTPRLVMRALPNPRPIFEQLKQRMIAVKRQRGVIKMDVGGGAPMDMGT